MPYSRAHYVLLAGVPLIVVAFWPFYFSRLAENPLAIHVHGVTGSAWILLLILQSWAIHNRKVDLHRLAGKSSFLLFTLFLAGGLMVLHSMAQGVATGANPFIAVYGPGLGAFDIIAVTTFAGLYFSALRHRRSVQLHARYMLATPLLLLSPIFGRLFASHVPGLTITGPETMHLFVYSLHLANGVALAAALALFASAPKYGRPFLAVAGVVLLQSIVFQWLLASAWWRELYGSLGSLPASAPAVLGLAAGVVVAWLGWTGGRTKAGQRPQFEPAG